MDNIFREINQDLTEEDILMLSPLQLAYIGDGIYEVFIRTYLLSRGKNVNEMNKKARKLVNANAQANIVAKLDGFFTEKEKKIIKRGRNTKVNTSPKNMDIMDYKYATGFEALIGSLYLNRQYERLYELMDKILYGHLLMKLEGVILGAGETMDLEELETRLKNFFAREEIIYEGLGLRELEEEVVEGEASREIEIRVDFPMTCFVHEDDHDIIYDKFIDFVEKNQLSFGGGAVLELKEEENEG